VRPNTATTDPVASVLHGRTEQSPSSMLGVIGRIPCVDCL
jgi:hypothetical protein